MLKKGLAALPSQRPPYTGVGHVHKSVYVKVENVPIGGTVVYAPCSPNTRWLEWSLPVELCPDAVDF